MSGEFERLARYIAQRVYLENLLSDVTWAVMRCVPELTRDVCRFFGVEVEATDHVNAVREFPLGERKHIDFAIESGAPVLFVESKIYDRNYHFDEYPHLLNDTHSSVPVGLLVNHILATDALQTATKLGWRTRYWSDLLRYLRSRDYGDNQSVARFYLEYAGRVCDVEQLPPIRLEEQILFSLYGIHQLFDRIIKRASHDRFEYQQKDVRGSFGDHWFGTYYRLVNTQNERELLPWVGVAWGRIEDGQMTMALRVSVSLDDDPNGEIAERLKTHVGEEDDWCAVGDYGAGVELYMSRQRFRELNSASPVKQEDLLRQFFTHVNSRLERSLSK